MGSVVLLKGAEKRLMICGWLQQKADGSLFDYSGCLYPEGIISSDELVLFNDEDIEHLFYLGMQDSEQMAFSSNVKKRLEEEKNEKS